MGFLGRAARTVLLLTCLLLEMAHSADVWSCGGFLRASDELHQLQPAGVDFSFASVVLLTSEGLRKQTYPVGPNGYFLAAIYEKGNFELRLEADGGWLFDPPMFAFSVGGQDSASCTDLESRVSFEGFDAVGQVIGASSSSCSAPGAGPEGMAFVLQNESGAEVSRTHSDASGKFVFHHLFPGVYAVHMVLEKSSHLVADAQSGGVRKVTVGWNTATIDDFHVSGYSVQGEVDGVGEEVEHTLWTLLQSSGAVDGVGCGIPDTLPTHIRESHPLLVCASRGRTFAFEGTPCGAYSMSAVTGDASLTFSPESVAVDVVHEQVHVVSKNTFSVASFAAQGFVRVTADSSSATVAGATVHVQGSDVNQVTGEDGIFQFRLLTNQKISLTAEKEGLTFSKVTVDTSIVRSSLPAVTVSSVRACGKVNIDHPGARLVRAMPEAGGNPVDVRTDANGAFCLKLAPAAYQLTAESRKKEILFPKSRRVVVADTPLSALDFQQSLVSVHGRVACLHTPCRSSPQVAFSSSDDTADKRSVTVDKNGEFTVPDVAPGTYQMEIVAANECWAKKSLALEVGSEDVTSVLFEQVGYALRAKVSHDMAVDVIMQSEATQDAGGKTDQTKQFNLQDGSNTFCVKQDGIYEVWPSSCYRFDQDYFVLDTSKPEELSIEAALVKAHGVIEARVHDVSALPDSITVRVGARGFQTQVLPADREGNTFTFSFFAVPSVAYTATPVTPQSHALLFDPPVVPVVLRNMDTCPVQLDGVIAKLGVFAVGSVEPAVQGVKITVSQQGSEKITTGITDTAGKYSIGPLSGEHKYSISASAPGYHITAGPLSPSTLEQDFTLQRLASVRLVLRDENASEALQGVVVSLSGDAFQKHQVSDEHGAVLFDSLFPGVYYTHLILKEYNFGSKHQASKLQVQDGAQEELVVTGSRVAFSVFGRVHSMTGTAQEDVFVVAVSHDKSHHEETRSSADGSYRLRGLKPGVQYEVAIKSGATYDGSSPASSSIDMPSHDVRDVHFAVFPRVPADVTGVVLIPPMTAWPSLPPAVVEISLRLAGQPDTPIRSTVVPVPAPATALSPFLARPLPVFFDFARVLELDQDPAGVVVHVGVWTHQEWKSRSSSSVSPLWAAHTSMPSSATSTHVLVDLSNPVTATRGASQHIHHTHSTTLTSILSAAVAVLVVIAIFQFRQISNYAQERIPDVLHSVSASRRSKR